MAFRRKALLAATCLSLLSGTTATAEVGVADKEIIIGNPNAQSGDNQFSGKETTVGLKAYINTVNSEGGVFGRKIKIITCDDKYDPQGALDCFKQLSQDGAFAIAGLVGSALLAKYTVLCAKDKVPMVGAYSGPHFVTEPTQHYVFTTRPSYPDEEQQFADHMVKDVGVKKIAIIYQQDAYGADHLQGLTNALKKHGLQLVAAGAYKRNTLDVLDAFNTVRAAKPDAVSLAANNKQCTAIIKMARESNWNPIFYINSGANVDAFLPSVGKEADGVLVSETVPSPTQGSVPLINKYLKALKQWYPNEKPCFTSLRGYIDGLVLVEGLKKAGKDLTRERFIDALEQIKNLDIGLGKGSEVTYGPNDHVGLHKFLFGLVSNGDVTPVTNWKKLKP